MLDRYLWGEVRRISPEAPVPVFRVRERTEVLGGAGNVAANLAGLECQVTLVGVRGSDATGTQLEALLSTNGIEHHLAVDALRPTIAKTRIMAQGQQLLRLDEEDTQILSPELRGQLLDLVEKNLPHCKATILSDYGKGVLQTPGVSRTIIDLCCKHDVPVLVDPKGKDWERYQGATCITPNTAELEVVTGLAVDGDEDKLLSSASSVRERYDLAWLLVTRGPKGMCLVSSSDPPLLIPAQAREVYDVSGAGDTVIATLAAGAGSGLPFPEAAALANTAAGVVVGKLGTQPVTRAELDTALRIGGGATNQTAYAAKTASLAASQMQVQSWRTSGETIVFTNGCFDLLHPGHIHLLHQARALGDRLIVGLNTDASVRRLKGSRRPILSELDRAAILSALRCVDLVVLFDEDTLQPLIKSLRPDILAKGADYRLEGVVGREIVESYGGQVCLVPLLEGSRANDIAAVRSGETTL